MNRIFKFYEFAFKAKSGANRISFSSYPGYLESLDDFYMMDSGPATFDIISGISWTVYPELLTRFGAPHHRNTLPW